MYKYSFCHRTVSVCLGICLSCHFHVLCWNSYRYGHSCDGMRIGNRTKAFEWSLNLLLCSKPRQTYAASIHKHLEHSLVYFSPNSVVNRVQFWTVGVWWNESGCLPFRKADCLTCLVCRSTETQMQWNTNRDLHMPYWKVLFRMSLNDLAKYLMTQSIAWPLCNSSAFCLIV